MLQASVPASSTPTSSSMTALSADYLNGVRSVRSSATVGPGDSTTNTSVLSLNLKRKAFLPDCLENRPSRRLDEFCDSIKCHHLEIKQLKE